MAEDLFKYIGTGWNVEKFEEILKKEKVIEMAGTKATYEDGLIIIEKPGQEIQEFNNFLDAYYAHSKNTFWPRFYKKYLMKILKDKEENNREKEEKD